MTRRDKLIWAAGFFDGEGCVHIGLNIDKRRRIGTNEIKAVYRHFQMCAVVYQKVRDPLEIFVELFGGRILRVNQNGWFYWQFKLYGKKAVPLLEGLLPYFLLKREAATNGLRFQEYLDASLRHGKMRSDDEVAVLEGFREYSLALNARSKKEDRVGPKYQKSVEQGLSGDVSIN